MQIIFVDTSAWCAVRDEKDENHNKATSFLKEIIEKRYHLKTTNYILDETYTRLLGCIGCKSVIQFKHSIDQMLDSKILTMIQISEFMQELAWEVFERFNADKEWSFTDCTSKVVMEQDQIGEVFAFDHHFEQMRFIRKP